MGLYEAADFLGLFLKWSERVQTFNMLKYLTLCRMVISEKHRGRWSSQSLVQQSFKHIVRESNNFMFLAEQGETSELQLGAWQPASKQDKWMVWVFMIFFCFILWFFFIIICYLIWWLLSEMVVSAIAGQWTSCRALKTELKPDIAPEKQRCLLVVW